MKTIRPGNRRTTLKDVAAAVGVSVATVSYVLNGKHTDRVSAATRRRVLKAVDELNYSPNATARSLVTSRTGTLGVYLPQHLENVLMEPGTDQLLSGIIQKAALEDYQIVLAIEGNDPRRYGVDAWLCIQPGKTLETLEKRELPLVYVDPQCEGAPSTITPADEEAGILIGSLLSGTSKHVAFVQDLPESQTPRGTRQRLLGLQTGLGKREPYLLSPRRKPPNVESWLDRMLEMTGHLKDFDTVVTANETLGTLLLGRLLRDGKRVPEQIQVAAFGDTGVSRWATPSLTIVDLKYAELAYRATRILLQHLKENHAPSALKLEGSPTPVLKLGETTRQAA